MSIRKINRGIRQEINGKQNYFYDDSISQNSRVQYLKRVKDLSTRRANHSSGRRLCCQHRTGPAMGVRHAAGDELVVVLLMLH